jgi:hypothetical protein
MLLKTKKTNALFVKRKNTRFKIMATNTRDEGRIKK